MHVNSTKEQTKVKTIIGSERTIWSTYPSMSEFLILEYGILLKKWVRELNEGEITNFIYNSIEHDGPILEFRYINEAWEIYSDWRISEKEVVLSSDDLLVVSKRFLEELEHRLKETYDIELNTGIL